MGRVRHLATADLWIQQRVKAKQLQLFKLPGQNNPSDLMTKYKSAPDIARFLKMLGIHERAGRPDLAPVRVPSTS